MTTAQPTPRRGRPLLGPLSVTASVGLLLVALAAVLTGPSGAVGALIGTAMVCVVFAFGAVVLGVVAFVAPAASLLVALLTYTLQVVLVGLVYVGLSSGGALEGPVDERWLSGAVIAATLAWTVAQIVVTMRGRQLVYDLPSHDQEASVR
jgi:ATP synthase protein I